MNLETAAGFLTERRDFLYVYIVPSVGDSGWDIVMRIDGTYADRRAAEAAAQGIREWMDRLTDVPKDRRIWWSGPPWLATP